MGRIDYETETMIAHTPRGNGFDASEDGTGRGTPLVPVAFGAQNSAGQGDGVAVDVVPTLDKSKTPAIAFDLRGRDGGAMVESIGDTVSLRAADGGSSRSYVAADWAVRRLLPSECHALQGFPRDWCNIPWRGKTNAPDGPQYKALGNSMAVPVIAYILDRMRRAME
jgi:DNA (cytosine-5)-methyltransferase 1